MPDQPFLPRSELAAPIVHPPGSGKVVTVLGDESVFKVRPEETGGAYALLEQRIPAGHGPPLHVHRHETEIFYILEGQFELTIGDRKVAAPPGAMLAGPRDVPHTFRNVGTTEGRLLLYVIPGRFANFFLEVDGVSFTDQEKIKALAAKYDVEILGVIFYLSAVERCKTCVTQSIDCSRMSFRPLHLWRRCHWSARLCAMAVFAAILIWQARFTWSVHNPMYGWPMPFDNLWYSERAEWSPMILALDAIVWVVLVGSTAYVLEQMRKRQNGLRVTLSQLFILQAVVAMVIAIGCVEGWLRLRPNNDSLFPRYGTRTVAAWNVWFDIGLFTDPVVHRPLVRSAVILAIGCAAYTAVDLFTFLYTHIKYGTETPVVISADNARVPDPKPVRAVELALWGLFLLFALAWLLIPKVH